MNEMLTLDAALERLLAAARPIADSETVSTFAAAGRVLAADQRSSLTVPPHDNSSMDGYAVRLADLDAPGCCLGAEGDTAPKLGWVTWVKSVPMNRDPDETVYRLQREE